MIALDKLCYAPHVERGHPRTTDVDVPQRRENYRRAMERIRAVICGNHRGCAPRRVRCVETGEEWESVVECAGRFGVSEPTIRGWIRAKKTVGGRTFKWSGT